MKKKIISLLLVSALTIASLGLLGGCGEEKEDEEIVITMLYSGTTAGENDFETVVLKKLVEEKFENVTLEVTKLPDDSYYTTLTSQLNSGECADIILVQPKYAGANGVYSLADAGYLEDLSDLECLDNIGESSLDAFTYDGKVYGVPSGVTILGAYYNKDIFAQYGLEVPETWADFLNVCETLKSKGVQPIVMGDSESYVMQFGLYQLAANEIYPDKPDFDADLRTGDTKFTDQGTWDKVFEMYTELYDKGYIDATDSLSYTNASSQQEFIDGNAGMIFDGSFNAAKLAATDSSGFERGYFPLPSEDGDNYAAMAPGAGPAIYNKSENKDICKEILNMWYDGESEIYKAAVDAERFIPTYGYGVDNVNPLFTSFMDLYNQGKTFYWANQAWPSGVSDEMQALLSEYISGQGTTVDDITKGMQAKFDEVLQ